MPSEQELSILLENNIPGGARLDLGPAPKEAAVSDGHAKVFANASAKNVMRTELPPYALPPFAAFSSSPFAAFSSSPDSSDTSLSDTVSLDEKIAELHSGVEADENEDSHGESRAKADDNSTTDAVDGAPAAKNIVSSNAADKVAAELEAAKRLAAEQAERVRALEQEALERRANDAEATLAIHSANGGDGAVGCKGTVDCARVNNLVSSADGVAAELEATKRLAAERAERVRTLEQEALARRADNAEAALARLKEAEEASPTPNASPNVLSPCALISLAVSGLLTLNLAIFAVFLAVAYNSNGERCPQHSHLSLSF